MGSCAAPSAKGDDKFITTDYLQQCPEKFFKMVRYFGFLANRVCGEKLPQVYRALGMDKPEAVAKVCYAQMMKQFLRALLQIVGGDKLIIPFC